MKFMKNIKILVAALLSLLFTPVVFTSCNNNLPDDVDKATAVSATISKSELILNEKNSTTTEAFTLNWTTGTNNGTGAAIAYTILMDVKTNNFSNPVRIAMGKGIYTRKFTVKELNDSLIQYWKIIPGTPTELEVKIETTIFSSPASSETSPVLSCVVTPYKPVSKTLFLFGSASPKGTDLNLAIALKPDPTEPTVFAYQGQLNPGNLKFITTLGQLLPSYNKGANDVQLLLRSEISEPDNMFDITLSGVYKVVVNLLDLSVTIEKINYPAYSDVYLTGSASPNGSDYTKATKLTQSSTNPFVFSYQGVLKAGSFKFSTSNAANGNQEMFVKVDDSNFNIEAGSVSNAEWDVTKKGYYTLTIDQQNNSISIYREKLYMVGSATPVGWTISNAVEMTEDATDGCIFTWTGNMTTGEFKLPVNRNSDWNQDMYMKVDDTKMYRHIGGQADDNKWTISVAGNYVVTADIETLKFSFVKQ